MNVELIMEPGAAWENCERRLDELGTPLPLYHRAIWARATRSAGVHAFLVVVKDHDSGCRAAFAVESSRSRALPGHHLWAILRLGIGSGGIDRAALEAALAALMALMQRDPMVLRASVDVFAIDGEARALTADALQRCGFARVPATRSYERTLLLDLHPDEESLFAGVHKNARQGVRNIAKFPVHLGTARSADLAPRLQQLADDTRARTGGERRPVDWRAFIEMSNAAPTLSRIATLERSDVKGPGSLVAFAWGCMHGDVAEYSESGSVRVEDMKISTSYALLWDLIIWARRSGAKWFDLGGITRGTTDSDDPLGGISDFKRRFSQREVEVGEQWELTARPFRAALARTIGQTAALVRSRVLRDRS